MPLIILWKLMGRSQLPPRVFPFACSTGYLVCVSWAMSLGASDLIFCLIFFSLPGNVSSPETRPCPDSKQFITKNGIPAVK